MPEDWSREEVEAAVADYLTMLRAERTGVAYNKSAHRRALARLLNDRSDGSIEFKHQNISAVLLELRMPYVEGYKPASNYQRLLLEVVAEEVERMPELHAVLTAEAVLPASIPTVENILETLVAPPSVEHTVPSPYSRMVRETTRPNANVDYVALEAANRSLGAAGEEFTIRFEQARLLAARQDRLAGLVERVSQTRGDTLGFDVLSFEIDGRERFIEVKTTAYGPVTPFFVTRNELAVSRASAPQYHLYRVFDFRRRPRLFQLPGQIDQSVSLDPVQYLARLRDA